MYLPARAPEISWHHRSGLLFEVADHLRKSLYHTQHESHTSMAFTGDVQKGIASQHRLFWPGNNHLSRLATRVERQEC